jgi:hypothetical protein
MGWHNFISVFIEKFAFIMSPITKLFKKFEVFEWTTKCQTLLEILGFATKIQLHATHVIANLCSCLKQVAHDIQLRVTLCMQHIYTMLIYMFIHTH